jgi:hypothetical protein
MKRELNQALGFLASAGQPLHGWQTPDGYKTDAATWLSPEALSRRADFAIPVGAAWTTRSAAVWLAPATRARIAQEPRASRPAWHWPAPTTCTSEYVMAAPDILNPFAPIAPPSHRPAAAVLALPWAALLGGARSWCMPSTRLSRRPKVAASWWCSCAAHMTASRHSCRMPTRTTRNCAKAIAIPAPDGTAQTAISLDDTLRLHPALAPLLPLWQQGVLALCPPVACPRRVRSHFEAQHYWEIGQPGKNSAGTGWLNTWRVALLRPRPRALGVGEANPEILRGTHPSSWWRGATRPPAPACWPTTARARRAMDLYATSATLGGNLPAGCGQPHGHGPHPGAGPHDGQRPNAGRQQRRGNAAGLQLDARHLAALMRQDRQLRVGFLSAGGWDTHANQGGVTGPGQQPGQPGASAGHAARRILAARRRDCRGQRIWPHRRRERQHAAPTTATAMPCC